MKVEELKTVTELGVDALCKHISAKAIFIEGTTSSTSITAQRETSISTVSQRPVRLTGWHSSMDDILPGRATSGYASLPLVHQLHAGLYELPTRSGWTAGRHTSTLNRTHENASNEQLSLHQKWNFKGVNHPAGP